MEICQQTIFIKHNSPLFPTTSSIFATKSGSKSEIDRQRDKQTDRVTFRSIILIGITFNWHRCWWWCWCLLWGRVLRRVVVVCDVCGLRRRRRRRTRWWVHGHRHHDGRGHERHAGRWGVPAVRGRGTVGRF